MAFLKIEYSQKSKSLRSLTPVISIYPIFIKILQVRQMQDTGHAKNCLAIPKLLAISSENNDQLDFDISNGDEEMRGLKQNYALLLQKRRNAKHLIDSVVPLQQNSVILEKKALPNLIIPQGRKAFCDRSGKQSNMAPDRPRQTRNQYQEMSPFPYVPQHKKKEIHFSNVIKKLIIEASESENKH